MKALSALGVSVGVVRVWNLVSELDSELAEVKRLTGRLAVRWRRGVPWKLRDGACCYYGRGPGALDVWQEK